MSAPNRIAALALALVLSFGGLSACESDTSPAPAGNNPPPPPSRTPTALRHGPNTFPMSSEMSEEEAKKLLEGKETDAEEEEGSEPPEPEAPAAE